MTAQAPYESPDALSLAMRFHETYERLAPSFGYETRTETRAFDPATPNGRLMVAVCGELLTALAAREGAERAPVSAGGDAVRNALIVCHDVLEAFANNTSDIPWAEFAMARNVAHKALATPAPPVGADWVMVPREVVTFLNGETALEGLWFGEYPMTGGRPSTYWWRKYLTDALATPATVDVKHPQYEAGFKAGMRFEAKHRFFLATPAEARGVGDGVALLARAYEVVHHDADCPAIGGNGDDDCRCDAVPFLRDLRAALAANKPDTRQAQAQGSEGVEYGWLVENGKQVPDLRYRTIEDGIPAWTDDHMKALRFARREDAEMFAAEDDAAWRIAEHAWHTRKMEGSDNAAHAQAGEGSNG